MAAKAEAVVEKKEEEKKEDKEPEKKKKKYKVDEELLLAFRYFDKSGERLKSLSCNSHQIFYTHRLQKTS